MKKFYLLLTFSLTFFAFCRAQLINKGDWLIGGNATFKHSSSTIYQYLPPQAYKYVDNSWLISPGVGYFFCNRLAAGISVVIDLAGEKMRGSPTYSNTYVGVSPFARYYFLKPNSKINILADAEYGWLQNRYRSFLPGSNSSTSTLTQHLYSMAGGPCLFINPHIALEALLAYTHLKETGKYNSDAIQLKLGFRLHIGK